MRRPPIIIIPGAKTGRTKPSSIELTQAFERADPAAKGRSRLVPPETAAGSGATTTTTTVVNNTTIVATLTVYNVTADYTAAAQSMVRADATSASILVTLPSSAACQGEVVGIRKTDAGGNTVEPIAAGSDTIWDYGGASPLVAQGDTMMLIATRDASGNYGWDVV